MNERSFVQSGRGGAAPWLSLDLLPHEPIEEGLRRQFIASTAVCPEIGLVRQPEDGYSYREDVAYILFENNNGQASRGAVNIVFLRSHYGGSSPCVEYCTQGESQVPHAFDCPRTILEHLAPPTDASARIWREQCWQRVRHPLRDGDVVTFHALAPGLADPAGPTPYRVEWQASTPYPAFIHLQSGQRGCTPLWRMLPYTLHHRGEHEVAPGECSECRTPLGGPGAVCAPCMPRYLERRALFSEYVRTLEGKLTHAPFGAIWAPDRFVEGAGYYLSRLPQPLRGNAYRFSKIDLLVPGDELAQVWLGHCIEDAMLQAMEYTGGFPLSLVPVESWSHFAPHPIFAPLYIRRPGTDQEGMVGSGRQGD